jgi:hypothetical protein
VRHPRSQCTSETLVLPAEVGAVGLVTPFLMMLLLRDIPFGAVRTGLLAGSPPVSGHARHRPADSISINMESRLHQHPTRRETQLPRRCPPKGVSPYRVDRCGIERSVATVLCRPYRALLICYRYLGLRSLRSLRPRLVYVGPSALSIHRVECVAHVFSTHFFVSFKPQTPFIP